MFWKFSWYPQINFELPGYDTERSCSISTTVIANETLMLTWNQGFVTPLGKSKDHRSEWYWSKQMRVRNVYTGDANSHTYLSDLKPSELICCLLKFVQIQHLSQHVQEKCLLGQSYARRARCSKREVNSSWLGGDTQPKRWYLCTLSSPRHQTPTVIALCGL